MTPVADRPRHGFVYVPVVDNGPMANAEAGCAVRIPGRAPPWIVVDHEVHTVLVPRWPGRSRAVEIVDAITEQDGAPKQRPVGNRGGDHLKALSAAVQ